MRMTRAVVLAALASCGGGSRPGNTIAPDAPVRTDAAIPDGPAPGNIEFRPAVDFGAARGPTRLALADLDGDGRLDIVVGSYEDDAVSVLLNATPAGATTAAFAAHADFTTGDEIGSDQPTGSPAVAVADLDGDGRPDIIAGNSRGAISVLMNTTVGGNALSFAAHVDFPSVEYASSISVADFNGDGKPDLAVTANGPTNTDGTVSVFLNTTAGGVPSFAPRIDFAAGAYPTRAIAADVNADGRPDLVVVSKTLSILLDATAADATTPTFAEIEVPPTRAAAVGAAVGDFNGDGVPDLAATEDGDDGGPIETFLGTSANGSAAPAFGSGTAEPTLFWVPGGIAVGDLDGDGKPDIAATGGDIKGGVISVWLDATPPDAAAPTFAGRVDVSTHGELDVAIGDLNGDGKPDLAATSSDAGVSVLLAE